MLEREDCIALLELGCPKALILAFAHEERTTQKKARKMIWHTDTYKEITLPGTCSTGEKDLSMLVSCAQCGRPIVAGWGQPSRQILETDSDHNGYLVCHSCVDEELKHYREYSFTRSCSIKKILLR
jgi:hypothetical protein